MKTTVSHLAEFGSKVDRYIDYMRRSLSHSSVFESFSLGAGILEIINEVKNILGISNKEKNVMDMTNEDKKIQDIKSEVE